MARKSKIKIRRDEDFTEIDEELDQALQRLEGANNQVSGLLEAINEHGEAAMDGSAPITSGADEQGGEKAPEQSSNAAESGESADAASAGGPDNIQPSGASDGAGEEGEDPPTAPE